MSQNQTVLKRIRDHLVDEGRSDPVRVKRLLDSIRDLFPVFFSDSVTIIEREFSGLGVVSTKRISRGELVVVDHPVISISDVALSSSAYYAVDGGDSLGLTEAVCARFSASMEECFRNLFPIRTNSASMADISVPPELSDKLTAILPRDMSPLQLFRAIQLNSLGYYTFPELVTYDEGLRFLSGTGIYPKGSMFNHSCCPNVNHYSVGDVTFFRALTDIDPGEELFISYIGRDLLVEAKSIRDEFLDARDFNCTCSKCTGMQPGEDPWLEEIDLSTRVQLRLLKLPSERIQFIQRTLTAHNYISRDEFELKFALARELGTQAPDLWNQLINQTAANIDMQAVVVRMHYLRTFGNSESVLSEIRETAELLLGKDMGSLEFIWGLLSVTDFN